MNAAALATLLAAGPASALGFESASQGAVVDAGLGTTPVGDLLLGELGAQSAGLTTRGDGPWLLSWDALVALKGGELAAAHPYTTLFGGHARAFAELGRRLQPEGAWSAYVGGRVAFDVQILVPPGTSLSQLDTVNDLGGVGDVNVGGALRLVGGASLLSGEHALILAAFVEETGRRAETNLAARAVTEVGLAARFDLPRSLMLSAEALWGRTPMRSTPALGLTAQTTRTEISGALRKIFANGMWFGASLALSTESDVTVYGASGATYKTSNAPTFGLTLLYGFPLGEQRWPL